MHIYESHNTRRVGTIFDFRHVLRDLESQCPKNIGCAVSIVARVVLAK